MVVRAKRESEVIRYKTPEGKIHEGYFPFIGEPAIIDVVPGTHAFNSFLAYLAFNKYVLDTPLYRERYRLSGESMAIEHLCCMPHARAKFKYALEQGNDKDAAFILELIGELYRLERGKHSI